MNKEMECWQCEDIVPLKDMPPPFHGRFFCRQRCIDAYLEPKEKANEDSKEDS